MPEFLTLLDPTDALDLFLEQITSRSGPEEIPTQQALGRVVASEVVAPHPLPEFPRSTVDGFALHAEDTYGASESLPAYLSVVAEVPMGDAPSFQLSQGQAALIHTGGMIPSGANSVIMVEHTQQSREGEIEAMKAVAVGENVIKIGEDIKKEDVVITPGTRLRASELGGLLALGFTHVTVAKPPKVGILSSGDEVIPPEQRPNPGQVRDINGYTLSTLVESVGGEPIYYGIIPDSQEAMMDAASKAKESCDVVVITAGSSASTRDLTSVVLDQLGEPGVLVHGVNVRPGKPTILAVCDGKAMIGLPGNPVSALVIARIFVVEVIKRILGEAAGRPQGGIQARLTINLSSQAGREDWVPVRILHGEDGWCVEPVFGRSNLIFTLVCADGLIRIPPSATGLSVGEIVDVTLL